MAHIDRQPSDEVFKDLQDAAYYVWVNGDYGDDYIQFHFNVTNKE